MSHLEKKTLKKNTSKTINKNLDFEASLKELENLVAIMENQKLSLEDSLKYFEQGVKLSEICANALEAAELKIKIISQKSHTAPSTQSAQSAQSAQSTYSTKDDDQ